MTLILSETRERFLAGIIAKVPAERIAEIHFFPPIKQGGIESGVAVVAAWPEWWTAADSAGAVDSPPTAHPDRHVIYTARYRLILKGMDRGKWEATVFAEADAPLITVDAVVRGVQRRSGDVDDATRMDGDDVRAFALAHAARTAVAR